MAKHRIRTTKRPFEEIEVEGPELFSLTRQGLVLEVVTDAPARPVEAAVVALADSLSVPENAPQDAPVAEEAPAPTAPPRGRRTNNGGK